MEQRNGRIDRHGQKGFITEDGKRFVFVYHFVAEGYKQRAKENVSSRAAELDADLEFLMRVAQKVETIREDLGSYGTVLADDVEAAMLGQGYTLSATDAAETKADPVRKMLRFERDLKKHIDGLLEQYRETERELRLTPANREKVVEVALALADQPCLSPTSKEHVYRIPALKGSWSLCAEGLEHPHTKEVRPITFDENLSKGRDDVVRARFAAPEPRMFPVAVTFLVPERFT